MEQQKIKLKEKLVNKEQSFEENKNVLENQLVENKKIV